MDWPCEVARAERRIRRFIRETPLTVSPSFSEACGASVHFKLENLQRTGSFKARGAVNKVLALSEAERARGVVAASTGNHGAAVGYALGQTGAKGVVFTPEDASPAKLAAMRRYGVRIEARGRDPLEAELAARAYAEERRMAYVSPYNDAAVVAGQGSVGVELARQLERIDVVFAALGGGGLISGIAAYLKWLQPDIQVVACSPANSPAMLRCLEAGAIIDTPCLPTLSDGTAGGVEPGAITFDLCRDTIDRHVVVEEAEIRDALQRYIQSERQVIEGAAAVAVAGLLKTRASWRGMNAVVVVCGGNIGLDALRAALAPDSTA